MTESSFQDQLADMWRTRPVRLRGPVSGVSAGIGYRYGIDPVLVRVVFVVAALFGGGGIVAYLAAWLLLPKYGDAASAAESALGRGHSSMSGGKIAVLVVAFLVFVTASAGPGAFGMGGSSVLVLALLALAWWFLHRRTPQPPPLPQGFPGVPGTCPVPLDTYTRAVGLHTPYAADSATPPGPYQNQYSPYTRLPDHYVPDPPRTGQSPEPAKESGERPTPPATPTPPQWDPLGVAPFAWDLPEPAGTREVAEQPRAPRSRLTPVVIGLATLTAVAGAVTAGTTGIAWFTPGRIAAMSLAVVGIGLVIGALTRRGHGLLVVAAPLAGFTILASLVGPLDGNRNYGGDFAWTPTSMTELQSTYSIGAGSSVLDLRQLDLTADRTVTVDTMFGHTAVLVPPGMNVTNDCTAIFGENDCLPDGPTADGPLLTLEIDNSFGHVEVLRG
ncbi:PspC domain-containing protein [Rhodococcus rhodnii]|nr:PspC domain-containing protein [Rhodococcus rhodnii]TXG90461.1 PspC domain-containing protein [Rhodococcus rhodnii]